MKVLLIFHFMFGLGGQFYRGPWNYVIPSPSSASKIKIKISGSTEGVDCSNISIYGFYLLKVPMSQRFWRRWRRRRLQLQLTQKDGKNFASGKIIKLDGNWCPGTSGFLSYHLHYVYIIYFIIGHLQNLIQLMLSKSIHTTLYPLLFSYICNGW